MTSIPIRKYDTCHDKPAVCVCVCVCVCVVVVDMGKDLT
jgi:hypothetical protein